MIKPVVSVVGLGYIGLPTAAVIASRGLRVVGVDVNREAVETINRGEIHIVEPDLDRAVYEAVASGNLRAYTEPQPADVFLIAVPTPFKAEYRPDLSYIESASRAIAKVLKAGDLVVLESTSPVGATESMCEWMAEERPDLTFPHAAGEQSDIRVAHCPERVLPGQVLRELVENDRIIGGMSRASAEAASRIYALFVSGELIHTDARTAEMCKLTENAYRDLNIAFANELSLIADRLDINAWELIRLANHHPRVNILQPGPGVGGHCIAVDPWFIISAAPDLARLVRAAREVNDSKPDYVVSQVCRHLVGVRNPVVACLGLAFKPNVDDLRESPAVKIAEKLSEIPNLTVLAVEPHVKKLPPSLAQRSNVELVSFETAISRANVFAALVKHDSLVNLCRSLDLADVRLLDFVNLASETRLDALEGSGSVPALEEVIVPALAEPAVSRRDR